MLQGHFPQSLLTKVVHAMSDPFQIIGSDWGLESMEEAPPTFDEAVRDAITRLETVAGRFDSLYTSASDTEFSPEEWRVVELAARDVEEAAERLDEGYVAVQYDSHAWYRILENLQKVRLRLESAIGIMEQRLAPTSPLPPDPE